MKILITGSNGLVGSSLTRILTTSNPSFNILPTTRKDANLFSFEETKNLILSKKPDVIVNAAAKVEGYLQTIQIEQILYWKI